MTARLHCFGESGNCYKAALTMALTGYDWEPVWVDFFHGASRSAEFLAINEMGEAPVFIEGEVKLTQSCVIQLHVADRTGKLLQGDRAEILRWLFADDDSLPGTPVASLRSGRHKEVKRRAQAMAF